jgi:hypothetical protein
VSPLSRRDLIAAALVVASPGGALAGDALEAGMSNLSPPIVPGVTLLSAPIELAGDWGRMIPNSADRVVEAMRHACLDGVRLVSDRQPSRLRVDEHPSGPPAVWLHDDGSTTAWTIVDIGQQAWSQLAYQFGHELGHVFANSWQPHAEPGGPCQWLEEALVEAFSLRGLARLADRWERSPPFAGDSAYGAAIRGYGQDIVRKYAALGAGQGGLSPLAAWFGRHRTDAEAGGGLNPFAQAASMLLLDQYQGHPDWLEGLGALNRWPGRARMPIGDYLRLWEASCAELQASSGLPTYLRRELTA